MRRPEKVFSSELSDLLKKAMALGGLTEAPSHRRSKRPHARQQADPFFLEEEAQAAVPSIETVSPQLGP